MVTIPLVASRKGELSCGDEHQLKAAGEERNAHREYRSKGPLFIFTSRYILGLAQDSKATIIQAADDLF
jgi:hypothetical protein